MSNVVQTYSLAWEELERQKVYYVGCGETTRAAAKRLQEVLATSDPLAEHKPLSYANEARREFHKPIQDLLHELQSLDAFYERVLILEHVVQLEGSAVGRECPMTPAPDGIVRWWDAPTPYHVVQSHEDGAETVGRCATREEAVKCAEENQRWCDEHGCFAFHTLFFHLQDKGRVKKGGVWY